MLGRRRTIGPKAKILVVEDEESLRFLYCEELKGEGYDPIPAENGKEAIHLLKSLKPDLIVLDIVMPVMDGMEALGRIACQYRDIPIILHTAYSGYKQDFMSWAADGFLTKSSDLTELKEAIINLLQKKRPKYQCKSFLKREEKNNDESVQEESQKNWF